MTNRIDDIVTMRGDRGQTYLADGQAYAKHDVPVELVGALDEANATLGMVQVALSKSAHLTVVIRVQSRLFDIGGAVALGETRSDWQPEIQFIDEQIALLNENLGALKEFVLPGSTEASARIHLARTVVRRAERHWWGYATGSLRESDIGKYLNRLSDYLFVLARTFAEEEILWQPMPQSGV